MEECNLNEDGADKRQSDILVNDKENEEMKGTFCLVKMKEDEEQWTMKVKKRDDEMNENEKKKEIKTEENEEKSEIHYTS